MSSSRDFNTISPSAGALLMMKALTDIPFASDTAAMVGDLRAYTEKVREKRSKLFIGRLIHFENRYKTINLALRELQPANILELSSGFSCRGLAMALQQDISYVDTDLPQFIDNKKILVERLIREKHLTLKGHLYVEPLNALDEIAFRRAIDLLPPGPVVIVNEGLLVYLDTEEKKKLCAIVHSVLKERGGYWVTADIYLKRALELQLQREQMDEELSRFLEAHNVEANKFESNEEAETFFTGCGFAVTRRIDIVFEELGSLQYIPYPATATMVREWMKSRETWVLQPL